MSPSGTLVLVGALIDRVDRPAAGLYALTLLAARARHVLLIATGPPRRAPAWALASERPRGDAADGEVRGMREKLEGARISRAWSSRGELGLEAKTGETTWWARATRAGFAVTPPIEGRSPEGDEVSLSEAGGEALVQEHAALLAEGARSSALASLKKLTERVTRRIAAIQRDATEVERASARAESASLFVGPASKARAGTTELLAIDWSSGEPREISMTLDPAKPARAQLDALFARAKRLRAGQRIAEARMAEAERALEQLDRASSQLSAPLAADEVLKVLSTLARELPGDLRLPRAQAAPSSKHLPPKRSPHRTFASRSGAPILVGRDARGNDELTVKVARPGDLWLHVRGAAGSHVVVPGWAKREPPDHEALLDAATLAAHFSTERDEGVVDVAYTDRRHVRKRRGSPVGLVEVTQESVIAVRKEESRLLRLLSSEDRDLCAR